jgi:hypothetical protein
MWLLREAYLLVSQWVEVFPQAYCWGMEPSMWQLDLIELVFHYNLPAML